jgi:hypothetical protein
MNPVVPLTDVVSERATGTETFAGSVFGGFDGGSSGAMVFVDQSGHWAVQPVFKVQVRGHWLLQIDANLDFIDTVAKRAGGRNNLVVAYEEARKNPRFGTKNNFVNGRNEEFWRVLLSAEGINNVSVDPKTWQSVCLKGITLADTKDRAYEYIRRRCPETEWLDAYNKAPREAIVDAMCIALWCRDHHQLNQSSSSNSSPSTGLP